MGFLGGFGFRVPGFWLFGGPLVACHCSSMFQSR